MSYVNGLGSNEVTILCDGASSDGNVDIPPGDFAFTNASRVTFRGLPSYVGILGYGSNPTLTLAADVTFSFASGDYNEFRFESFLEIINGNTSAPVITDDGGIGGENGLSVILDDASVQAGSAQPFLAAVDGGFISLELRNSAGFVAGEAAVFTVDATSYGYLFGFNFAFVQNGTLALTTGGFFSVIVEPTVNIPSLYLSVPYTAEIPATAPLVSYTPGDATKWSGSPTTVQQAIDRIAAVVGTPDPIP